LALKDCPTQELRTGARNGDASVEDFAASSREEQVDGSIEDLFECWVPSDPSEPFSQGREYLGDKKIWTPPQSRPPVAEPRRSPFGPNHAPVRTDAADRAYAHLAPGKETEKDEESPAKATDVACSCRRADRNRLDDELKVLIAQRLVDRGEHQLPTWELNVMRGCVPPIASTVGSWASKMDR
jgi:hypothetical protein